MSPYRTTDRGPVDDSTETDERMRREVDFGDVVIVDVAYNDNCGYPMLGSCEIGDVQVIDRVDAYVVPQSD